MLVEQYILEQWGSGSGSRTVGAHRLIQVIQTHISDGLLGLLLSVPGLLDNVFHLSLHLNKVSLKLLLGVQQAGVLEEE